MKKLIYFPLMAVLLGLASCQFFETDPNSVLNEDQYMSKESEMYRGFLGIVTRMQEAGDHAIFLTDTRSNYLETTGNAPIALQNIYRYEATDGNEYADPKPYYALIVSCNDFMTKMDEFYREVDGALSDSAKVHIPRLVSSALRHKAWGYYMLGRIYGEAYWLDTNMTELEDLSNFTKLDMKGICASSGSACTSGSLDPSHVLLAIGRPHEIAHGSLRLSISEDTTDEDVEYIIKATAEVVAYLRSISPVWRDLKEGRREYVIQ